MPIRLIVSVPILVPDPIASPTDAEQVPPNQHILAVPLVGAIIVSLLKNPGRGRTAEFGSIVTLAAIRDVEVAAAKIIVPLNLVSEGQGAETVLDGRTKQSASTAHDFCRLKKEREAKIAPRNKVLILDIFFIIFSSF